MIKRTLFFSSPCFLSVERSQLRHITKGEAGNEIKRTFPIEDIGFVVLESPQIMMTVPVLQSLAENNSAVVVCDSKHMPSAMFLCLDGNSIQQEIFEDQINSSEPLKKNLWKQVIEAKITNQAMLLKKCSKNYKNLLEMAKNVKSGDSANQEAVASRFYWQNLFDAPEFFRDREGPVPNNALNYGYAIVRAATARALVGSGLFATLGIHHCNRYNSFCLADDIMEPYRIYVDDAVFEMHSTGLLNTPELSKDIKARLLSLLTCDVMIDGNRRPLMLALSYTTASLARCFSGEESKIKCPAFE